MSLIAERNSMWPSNLRLLLQQELLRDAQENQMVCANGFWRTPEPLSRDQVAQMHLLSSPPSNTQLIVTALASSMSVPPLMTTRIHLEQLFLMRHHQQQQTQQQEQDRLKRRFEDLQRYFAGTEERSDQPRPRQQISDQDFTALSTDKAAEAFELQRRKDTTEDPKATYEVADPPPSEKGVSSTDDIPSDSEALQKPKKKDEKWISMLNELREYKEKHGDCIVPRGYSLNPRLASWVAEQRKQYKLMKDGRQSSITSERVELLNTLNFAWNAQEAAWDRHMSELKQFRNQHRHCHVPLNYPDFPKLGLWVKEQRRHYTLMKQGKPSHMNANRAAQLEAIGFCWDTHEATWLDRLRELADFKEKHGNCIVPTNYSENPKLGTWVHHQRRQCKKFKEGQPCHITEERVRALESIGFVWHARDKSGSSLSSAVGDLSDSETSVSSVDGREPKRRRVECFD